MPTVLPTAVVPTSPPVLYDPGTGFPITPPNAGQNRTPTIQFGSQGMAVAYCQNLLNARIVQHPILWVDGLFGASTDQRVRQFQTQKGLKIDGIVGPETWGALEAGPPVIQRR